MEWNVTVNEVDKRWNDIIREQSVNKPKQSGTKWDKR